MTVNHNAALPSGTAGYRRGCHCSACRAAWAARMREYRQRRKLRGWRILRGSRFVPADVNGRHGQYGRPGTPGRLDAMAERAQLAESA
jgi:hypothetical protein